ncbi:acyl-CoA synthetase (AMP-forming)/AMP-acid ligase II [Allocatelliglobosispora scoriae]|uniref:Acyl-CoA synthetase (AMP-forming)/AMP-acid ligase II n=1 Tax=Allocatelliglobosispora scoriae TaxID=643052 RepID=A0A841BYQ9_9ACTN|nr:AMP-binding protein [Allocatelliglobosispora scoriae]MBB5872805.1 acyl-CoA synthetase (AMP-forming)/AMP-acid ligase II [Allocatelliglobosispora scoriae]
MDNEVAPAPNYVRRVLELFDGFGDAEAIVAGEHRLTYADLRTGVLTVSARLRQHGITPGMTVGILVQNPPEAVMLQLALHLMGCRSAFLAPNAPRRYRLDFLQLAGVEAFIYDARTLPNMGRIMSEGNPVPIVACLGEGGLGPDILAPYPPGAPELTPIDPADVPMEPASLFQTGGTTGQPKLVHHGQIFFQTLLALAEGWVATGQHRLRHLAGAGFWHVSGQNAGMITLFSGGTFVLEFTYNAETALAAIEREQITSVFMTPPILYEILDNPRLDSVDTSSVVMWSVGGSAIVPSRMAEAIDRIGPVIRPVYGMSEQAFITAYPGAFKDPEHPERLRSCGFAYGDAKIEVRDDDGKLCPTGVIGEVWATGGLTMLGYWGQPELTAETLVDGWVRTADVGYLDEDGYLFLVDRKKDIIITGKGSTNVYSRPIEDLLAGHPDVRAAAVVGVPDSATGEAVHAYVVVSPDAAVTAVELRTLVVETLSDLWAPREIEFIDKLPLTQVGKVDKVALRNRFLEDRAGQPTNISQSLND